MTKLLWHCHYRKKIKFCFEKICERMHLEPWQTSKVKQFVETVNRFWAINYFHKTLHLRCLTVFWIGLCAQIFITTHLTFLTIEPAVCRCSSKQVEVFSPISPYHVTYLFLYPMLTSDFLRFSGGTERN